MNKVNTLSEGEAGYIAGILDGETYVGVTMSNKVSGLYLHPSIAIYNSKKVLVEGCRDIIGTGGIHLRKPSKNRYGRKYSYVCVVSAISEVKSLLEQVLPFFVLKREQALLVLEYCYIHKIGEKTTFEEKVIYADLRELNYRGVRFKPEEFFSYEEMRKWVEIKEILRGGVKMLAKLNGGEFVG